LIECGARNSAIEPGGRILVSATEQDIGATSVPFSPVMPPLAPDNASGLQICSMLRRNAFSAFPSSCLSEPVVKRMVLGRALVLVNTPDAIRQVLSTNAELYQRLAAIRRVLGPIIGRGLPVSEGENWRRQRQTLAPTFTPRNLPVLTAHIMKCAEAACASLEASRGQPIDLLNFFRELSLNIATTSMFSLEAAQFAEEMQGMVSRYVATLGRPTASDLLLPRGIPTLLGLRRKLFRRRWVQLIRSIIRIRREQDRSNAPRDLFDLLAEAHGSDAEDLLVDEVATMMLGGYENTSLAIFWACFLLAQAPEWQAAVTEEAAGVNLAPDHAAESLAKLRRTRAIIDEAMRLYSPAFMSTRQAAQSHQLCGVDVPKGAIVLMPLFLLHRNPKYWRSPDVFDPRRFLGDSKPDRFTYLPFGAGPNVCIGAQLATSEATLVLARLLRHSRLTLSDKQPVLPVATLSARPDRSPSFVLNRI
jgi:cytochrome P450